MQGDEHRLLAGRGVHLVRVDEENVLGEQIDPAALDVDRDPSGQYHQEFHTFMPVHLHVPDFLEQEFHRQFFVVPDNFVGEHRFRHLRQR